MAPEEDWQQGSALRRRMHQPTPGQGKEGPEKEPAQPPQSRAHVLVTLDALFMALPLQAVGEVEAAARERC